MNRVFFAKKFMFYNLEMAEITDAIGQNSIVSIADALAQKIGFSLLANDTVKETGALLAFEANKSATEVLFPTKLCFSYTLLKRLSWFNCEI